MRDLKDRVRAPSVGRLFIGGDSRAVPVVQIGGAMFVASGAQRAWTEIVRDEFGIPYPVQSYELPVGAAAASANAMLAFALADDNMLVWISIVPTVSVAANASNYRTFSLSQFPITYAVRDTRAGDLNGLSAQVEKVLYDFRDVATFPGRNTLPGNPGMWMSTALDVQITDAVTGSVSGPGGTLRTWVMNRYWNLAVSGAQLHPGHASNKAMTGCWSDWLQWQPKPRMPAPLTRATAAASGGATTVSVTALPEAMAIGDAITFMGGTKATLTATAALNATSITVSALPGAIAINELGAYGPSVYGNWRQALLPHIGLVVYHNGLNDAINNTFASRGTVWKEAARAVIAMSCCPYRMYVQPIDTATDDISVVKTNGSGGTSAWASVLPTDAWTSHLRYLSLTGTIGGTKPTIDLKVPPWRKAGQAIDIFFPCKAGSGNGYSATITWGAGAATPTALDFAGTVRVNNTSSATVDTGVASDLGPGGQGGVVCKRITGLPAGGGTIRITVDTQGNGGSPAFNVDLMGIEPEAGRGVPFLWMGLPHQPSKDSGGSGRTSDATLDSWNQAVKDVIAERTDDPRNVVYLDLDTYLGNADPDFFFSEGQHYNDLGSLRVADAVIETALANFTREQLMAR